MVTRFVLLPEILKLDKTIFETFHMRQQRTVIPGRQGTNKAYFLGPTVVRKGKPRKSQQTT